MASKNTTENATTTPPRAGESVTPFEPTWKGTESAFLSAEEKEYLVLSNKAIVLYDVEEDTDNAYGPRWLLWTSVPGGSCQRALSISARPFRKDAMLILQEAVTHEPVNIRLSRRGRSYNVKIVTGDGVDEPF